MPIFFTYAFGVQSAGFCSCLLAVDAALVSTDRPLTVLRSATVVPGTAPATNDQTVA